MIETTTTPPAVAGADLRRPARLAAAGAIAAFVAFVAAALLLPVDEASAAAEDIIARYADGSTGYLRAAVVQVIGVTALLVFAAGIAAMFRQARAASSLPTAAGLAAGVAAALQLCGYAVIATLAYGTAATGDANVVLAAYDLSSMLFVVSCIPLAVFLCAFAILVLRERVIWRWTGWLAAALAVLHVLAGVSVAREGALSVHGDVGFYAIALLHLWLVPVGIALLRVRTTP